jgi:hypothetical protein
MSKDFTQQIELQRLKKEVSSLKDEREDSEKAIGSLKSKIKELEKNPAKAGASAEQIKLNQIKLTSNVRDSYQYEELEELAKNIILHGQLQPALITKDNYLLAGYRRFYSLMLIKDNQELFTKELNGNKLPDYLIAYQIDKNLADLSEEKIDEIQYSENEQRRSLDNFQLSNLFNKYLEKGFEQKYICGKFNKKHTFVSAVISLRKIDPELVSLLKEFQIYAWSRKKYTNVIAITLEKNIDKDSDFYHKNRGILGFRTLYEIARQPDLFSQKKVFLKFFRNRLSDEELESDFFKDVLTGNISEPGKKFNQAMKHIKGLASSIDDIKGLLSDSEKKEVEFGLKFLSKLEQIIEKNSKKI